MFPIASNTDDPGILYVDDVFSTYLSTGNNAVQTITNGIDLAGNGGLVWLANRDHNGHFLFDTVQGATTGNAKYLSTTADYALGSAYLNAINVTNSGFSLNSNANEPGWINYLGSLDVYWTFRKAAKFFDIVTFTGTGLVSQFVNHNLQSSYGFIVIKRTDSTSDWFVLTKESSADMYWQLKLNSTAAYTGLYAADTNTNTGFFPSSFIGGAAVNGATYVAYVFAHDASSTGIIRCGSYTGNGNATGPVVSLGWEPQFLMIKNVTGTGSWQIIDNMRGMTVGTSDAALQANSLTAETAVDYVSPTATGFQVTSTSSEVNTSTATYIYMAIRRPNKPPTNGTEIFYPSVRTGTGAASSILGLPISPDLIITQERTGSYLGNQSFVDRLRGGSAYLNPRTTTAEGTFSLYNFGLAQKNIGIIQDNYINENGGTFSNLFFKRAPGFFDIVCYTGTGSGSRVLNHSLNAVPQLMIFKPRTTTGDNNWSVYCTASSAVGKTYNLNTTSNYIGTPVNTLTTTSITLSDNTTNNTVSYVAYLFATLAGVSKVGSYTGNNGSQIINCGFAAGARFILIKRTDAAGDWYVWDTARGIVPATDPHLSLNTTAAEVTTDNSIDPDNTGFIVNQVAATNINVTSATYIFLAIS